MRLIKCMIFVLGIASLGVMSTAFAQDATVCPKINCDCVSLLDESWQKACQAHETSIKKNCTQNNNTPADFCSLHGPSAFPLPLSLKLSNMEVLPEDEVKPAHKQSASLYWALHKDLSSVKAKVSGLDFKSALNLLSIMDDNLDTLFFGQRQVAMSWIVYEDEGEAISAWRTYADDTQEMADDQLKYGRELWKRYQAENSGPAKKAFKVIAFKVLRLAGKSYEAAGYSFAGGNKNKKAANAWSLAAEVSQEILVNKKESAASQSHINFYQYQAAARMHRASYYWKLEQKPEDALKALTRANEYSPTAEMTKFLKEQDELEAQLKAEAEENDPFRLLGR